MRVAEANQPERLAPTGPILGFLASAGVAVAVLLWLILAGPGYLGYGTSLLWAGAPRSGNHAFYDIAVNTRRSHRAPQVRSIGDRATPGIRCAQSSAVRTIEERLQMGASEMRPSPGASTYEFLFSVAPRGSVHSTQPRSLTRARPCRSLRMGMTRMSGLRCRGCSRGVSLLPMSAQRWTAAWRAGRQQGSRLPAGWC